MLLLLMEIIPVLVGNFFRSDFNHVVSSLLLSALHIYLFALAVILNFGAVSAAATSWPDGSRHLVSIHVEMRVASSSLYL
jgi:hypothetical protein